MQAMEAASRPNGEHLSAAAPADVPDIAVLLGENNALRQQNAALGEQLAAVQHQLAVFKKLLFGPTSERRPFDVAEQQELFERERPEAGSAPPKTTVPEHERGRAKKGFPDGCVNAEGLRFDESVPVKDIALEPEGIEGLSPEDYEVIGTEVRCKLAQRAASYEVLRYEQPVIKLRESGEILPLVPVAAVLDRSLADVSFLGGMLADKFVSHLPLYRQHQRLEAAGIHLARSTLTNLARRAIELLVPIHEAQWRHILASKVLAMDETPIKAGKSKTRKGRMHQGYFWPIFGEEEEICFSYAASRARREIERLLAESFEGTLLSDGYGAYAAFCRANEAIVHAQCWAHARRKFVEAREDEPVLCDRMLELIGALYGVEREIREGGLEIGDALARRQTDSVPIVEAIFAFAAEQRADPALLPSSPFSKALGYLENRPSELKVFLADAAVPIDTNHLERGIRPIAMGRRAWTFCWTELGAEHVGVIQSLVSTCRLHKIDPYTYLVDVLQRVGTHPAKEVIELTPRVWKRRFGDDPLRSDLARPG